MRQIVACGDLSQIVSSPHSARPAAGLVELHSMKVEDGIMKMRPLPRLELPAGKPVRLQSGGAHIMLMDIKQQIKPGDTVPIMLKIEGNGG